MFQKILISLYKIASKIFGIIQRQLILTSGLFDEAWYLKNNPDVAQEGMDAVSHFLLFGGFEGRDPSREFNSSWYLNSYKDIKINPVIHYLTCGRQEGRVASPTEFFAQDSDNYNKKPYDHNVRRLRLNTLSSELDANQENGESVKFFFIVGTGRCGTTLMAQVLNAHKDICVAPELQIIFEISSNGIRLAETFYSQKNLSFQAEDFIKLIDEKCPNKFREFYDYHEFFIKQDYPILSLKGMLRELYTDIALSQGKKYFAEQTPWYGQDIRLMNFLFPQAKFIHMVRDGRDVAVSFARTPWWSKDVAENLGRWKKEVDKIERDGEEFLNDRMITIRYEDLVIDPYKYIEKTCDFLEVPFEERLLDINFHVDYNQYNKNFDVNNMTSSAYNKWNKEKKTAFFTSSVFAWKNNTDVDFSNIDISTQNTLRRYRYQI